MIEVDSITKRYGAVTALAGGSFEIPRGPGCGARGPTGAAPVSYLGRRFGRAEAWPRRESGALRRARLADARRELADAPGRRLVRLALFDEVFGELPRRPPLATAEWSDWHPTQVRINFFPMSASPGRS